MNDHDYMQMALNLAEMMHGQTSPNPPVGAVVVKEGEIIGFGAHMKAGEPHAERYALEMAGVKARGATIYITLEPCSHIGKTPPCTEAIIEKGIKRVVIAMLDPNEKNDENSLEALKNSGIAVDVGVMQEEAMVLNEHFYHYMQQKRPFVTLKTAVTLDGKTAASSGESKWITGSEARKDVHKLRARSDAIMVGVNTIIQDNPALTARTGAEGKHPLRVILDTHLRTPPQSKVIIDQAVETWIFTGRDISISNKELLEQHAQVKVISLDDEKVQLEKVLNILGEERIMTLFVEGGSEVNGSFLVKKLVNEVIFYIAPKLFGGKNAYTSFGGPGFQRIEDAWDLEFRTVETVGNDLKITAVPRRG